MRIALTHASGRLEQLAPALEALGHAVEHIPLVAPYPRHDDDTHRAATALLGLTWRCYPSRSAVEAWMALGLPLDDGARLAAVGPGTAAALARHGADRVLTPPSSAATAAGLARALLNAGASGHPVGIVQGSRARSELANRLAAGGARPRSVVVYDVTALPWPAHTAVDAVLLASPSAVAALPSAVARSAQLVALGPTTAAAVSDRGWRCHVASEPTVAGALAALTHAAPARPAQLNVEAHR